MFKNLVTNFIALILISFSALNLFAQELSFRLPSYVRNSSKDINVNKESALQFSILKNGNTLFREKLLSDNLQSSFKTDFQNPVFLKYAYLKADIDAKVDSLLKLSNNLAQIAKIYDLRLVVIPYKLVVVPSENVQETLEKRAEGYILNLRLTSSEIPQKAGDGRSRTSKYYDDEDAPPPKQKTKANIADPVNKKFKATPLLIELINYYQFNLNGKPINEKELLTTIQNEFKQREGNGFYRSGTNEIDKSVSIKVSPQIEYKYLISLVDLLYGLKANMVNLRIDEIAD